MAGGHATDIIATRQQVKQVSQTREPHGAAPPGV
jgi:hypothetical protein